MQLSAPVIIVGMGIAGISAAISCAKRGIDTLCIEAKPNIGGTLIGSNIFSICGLYKIDQKYPILNCQSGVKFWLNLLNGMPIKIGRLWVYRLKKSVNVDSINKILFSFSNIEVKTNTPIQKAKILRAKVLIDCSSNASLIKLLNRKTLDPIKTCPGLNVIFKNVDISKLSLGAIDITKKLLSIDSSHSLRFYPQLTIDNDLPATVNLPPCSPELKQDDINVYYNKATKYLYCVFNYLCRHHKAFKNASISKIANYIGFRSNRAIKGLHCLSKDEIINRAKQNGIVCNWPIELWSSIYGPQIIFPDPDGYIIPFGCLFSVGSKPYILAAGLNISATPLAQSSSRVLASCMDTGYYAGKIAAELVQKEKFYTISL